MKAPVVANAARSGKKRSPGLKHGPTHVPLYGKSPSSPDRKRAYFPGFQAQEQVLNNPAPVAVPGKTGLGIGMPPGDMGCLSRARSGVGARVDWG